MKHKFSQSHFPIQTQSQRNSEGPRPRRLTKSLQPSSQCPMGTYPPHKTPQDTGWCVYTWHTRQGPDRACFSSSSGSNLRSTSYDHMPKKNRTHCVCKEPGSRSFISLWSLWLPWYWYRQIQEYDKLSSTQKNYQVVHTGVCTSLRIGLDSLWNHTRKSSSLAGAFYTFLWKYELQDFSVVSRIL